MSISYLEGQHVAVTGKIFGVTREQMKAFIFENGGVFDTGITESTRILIVGDKPTSAKIEKARTQQVDIMTYAAFNRFLKSGSSKNKTLICDSLLRQLTADSQSTPINPELITGFLSFVAEPKLGDIFHSFTVIGIAEGQPSVAVKSGEQVYIFLNLPTQLQTLGDLEESLYDGGTEFNSDLWQTETEWDKLEWEISPKPFISAVKIGGFPDYAENMKTVNWPHIFANKEYYPLKFVGQIFTETGVRAYVFMDVPENMKAQANVETWAYENNANVVLIEGANIPEWVRLKKIMVTAELTVDVVARTLVNLSLPARPDWAQEENIPDGFPTFLFQFNSGMGGSPLEFGDGGRAYVFSNDSGARVGWSS
jgi:BRCA1 C Terminus (BRCT) domain